MSHAPKMTYYARILSNIDKKPITKYQMYDTSVWYYGECNKNGGESEYIIEFNIWNNEPGFNAGEYDYYDPNAINCRLGIENCAIEEPILYARCVTMHQHDAFVPVAADKPFTRIFGSLKKTEGIIYGNTDHAVIQTKVVIPENIDIDENIYNFDVTFAYDYCAEFYDPRWDDITNDTLERTEMDN